MKLLGIHHITALAGDAQKNVDFYVRVIGLRLVKKTVNFDAPDVYHLYYGDENGRPGSILTFFPFPDAARGRRGAGEISAVAFSIPEGSLGFWKSRLESEGIAYRDGDPRFGETSIAFEDPDGMTVELVEDKSLDEPQFAASWNQGSVGPAYAVRKFHGVTMVQNSLAESAKMLVDTLGFAEAAVSGDRHRFLVGDGPDQGRVDILLKPNEGYNAQGAGSVHHIAWRVANDDEQKEWLADLRGQGLRPSPIMDRNYFHSVYFREPGGILYELATDPPGFAIDESPEELGMNLKLPAQYEKSRARIEKILPELKLPVGASR